MKNKKWTENYYFEGDCWVCDLEESLGCYDYFEHCDKSLDGCGCWHPHPVKLSKIRKLARSIPT